VSEATSPSRRISRELGAPLPNASTSSRTPSIARRRSSCSSMAGPIRAGSALSGGALLGLGGDPAQQLLDRLLDDADDDTSGERILGIPTGMAAGGSLLDFASLHILASPSLAALAALHPDGQWDSRRFRPNIVFDVDTPSGAASTPSGVESEWIGHELVGPSGTRLAVVAHTPRCVMPTLAQPGLGRDPKILQTTARNNRQPVASLGLFACAGAYAEIVTAGVIRTGDTVEVATENLATSSDLAVAVAQIEGLMAAAGRTGQ